MPKITFIGAGSAVFTKNLVADILAHPSLADSAIILQDIAEERLDTARRLAESVNQTMGTGARIEATTDRRKALEGADFVICTIGVGGSEAARIDLEVPLGFGLRQTVGDTLGVGGIFRSIRSIPVLLEICRDMEALCPDALLMNYTNPMAMHVLAVSRVSPIRVIGLCHGVVNTARTMRMLVALKDLPEAEAAAHFERPWNSPERTAEWMRWWELGDDPALSYTCAGINHMAAFLRFESGGVDLYPELKALIDHPVLNRFEPVRFELMRWLGYFMTETSGHSAEYVPYFLKDESEMTRCHVRVASYLGELDRLEGMMAELRKGMLAGEPQVAMPYRLSVEYASRILHAIVADEPFVFNGNVHNRGGALITNLPGDSCVEVPCVADRRGISPTYVGDLPPQVAALIRTNINVQDLTVRGILENNRDYFYQAAMMDPNTSSTLPLPKIRELMDAMFKAHAG